MCCASSLARSSALINDDELTFISFRKGNSDQNSTNPEKNKSCQEMTTSDNIIEWEKYTPRKTTNIQNDGIFLRKLRPRSVHFLFQRLTCFQRKY
mmetsp:Transcript_33768/g.34038  ORF Transcript_33768/g.34038 Transcript_33768/m.34038 type:complete len:95 (+) Transcript_33768:459-743(+)